MSKTIAAIATGNSVSGIGVIRISGDCAIEIAQKSLNQRIILPSPRLKDIRQNSAMFIQKAKSMTMRLRLFRAPKSYTGEDVVELSVHGGIFIVEKPWSLF